LAEPFRFHHLDKRLQDVLSSRVGNITLLVDWCNKSDQQVQRIHHKPELFWRMFQELAHEILHPQVTTLKIAYIDSIGGNQSVESLETLDRVVLQMREDAGGTFFTSPPRKLEGFRLVQSAEAYRIQEGDPMPHPFDRPVIHPVRVGLLAYSAPGCMLDKQSFWPFDDQGQIAPPAMEDLGRWKHGKYKAGIQPGQELRGLIERKKVEAILNSTNYTFVCESRGCHKCVPLKEESRVKGMSKGICNFYRSQANPSEPEHIPPYTCRGPHGRRLPDAPRDLEPGW
jgi:hypothetical protein